MRQVDARREIGDKWEAMLERYLARDMTYENFLAWAIEYGYVRRS